MIDSKFLEQLKSGVDITRFIDGMVPLKKRGSNYFACCPFHDEQSPSFSVSVSKQFYHCFGCKASGDVFEFTRHYLGVSFQESVTRVAQYAGVAMPEDGKVDQERLIAKQNVENSLRKITAWFELHLKNNQAAMQYLLTNRKIQPELIAKYQLGLAPSTVEAYTQYFNAEEINILKKTGILSDKTGKLFPIMAGRIIFPIRDAIGSVIGFAGRVMGQGEPKYLNSPESDFFSKGKELFRSVDLRNGVRKHECILVTEGYFDVIRLHEAGYTNAVAAMGTAISTENIEALFNISKTVVFCMDGDKAGRQSAFKMMLACLPYIGNGNIAKFAFLPDPHDPDSFLSEKNNWDAFAGIIKDAPGLMQLFLSGLEQKKNTSQIEQYSQIANDAVKKLSGMKDEVLKNMIVSRIAGLFGIPAHSLAKRKAVTQNNARSLALPKNTLASRLIYQLTLDATLAVNIPESLNFSEVGFDEIVNDFRVVGGVDTNAPYYPVLLEILEENKTLPVENFDALLSKLLVMQMTHQIQVECEKQLPDISVLNDLIKRRVELLTSHSEKFSLRDPKLRSFVNK